LAAGAVLPGHCPIRAQIAAEFDLCYRHSGCSRLLARLPFEYCKPKPLPQLASAENLANFVALYGLTTTLNADEAALSCGRRAS